MEIEKGTPVLWYDTIGRIGDKNTLRSFGCPLDFFPSPDRIAIGSRILGNQGPQTFAVFEPCISDMPRHPAILQRLAEDLKSAGKLSAHDRMFGMYLVQRPALILHIRT